MSHAAYIFLAVMFGAFAEPTLAQVSLPGPAPSEGMSRAENKAPTPHPSYVLASGNVTIADDNYRLSGTTVVRIVKAKGPA